MKPIAHHTSLGKPAAVVALPARMQGFTIDRVLDLLRVLLVDILVVVIISLIILG